VGEAPTSLHNPLNQVAFLSVSLYRKLTQQYMKLVTYPTRTCRTPSENVIIHAWGHKWDRSRPQDIGHGQINRQGR